MGPKYFIIIIIITSSSSSSSRVRPDKIVKGPSSSLVSSCVLFLPACASRAHSWGAWLSADSHVFPPKVATCTSMRRAQRQQKKETTIAYHVPGFAFPHIIISSCKENTTQKNIFCPSFYRCETEAPRDYLPLPCHSGWSEVKTLSLRPSELQKFKRVREHISNG